MATARLLLLSFLVFSLGSTSCLAIPEAVHLIKFKESLKNSSSLDSTWIKGTNPCDKKKAWAGVDCSDTDNKAVSSILLMNHRLSGEAADFDIEALSNLKSLRFFSLENNSFSGSIPEFNRLSSLKSLFLSGNNFSGEIPGHFFDKMGSLKKIHLSRNKFSGKIPESFRKLGSLKEILLDLNDFSGSVPSLEQESLKKIDLSYNKLEGEIPQSMSRFPAKVFEGNPDLCGSVVSKQCNTSPGENSSAPATAGNQADASNNSGAVTKWAILGIVVTALLVTILFKAKKKEENYSSMGTEHVDDRTVQVHVPSLNRRASMGSSRRRPNDSGSQSNKRALGSGKSSNDLVIVNDEKGMFGLPDLMKAAAEVLGSSGLGSAYKAVMANGVSVVVKRMRDMNKLSKDEFETEMRRLGRIRHRNILPPLAFHYRKEEKLLVSEYIPGGSLLFLLHGDRGVAHSELNWSTRLKIIKGVARGMGFLHTEFANFELPHGNLKSSNILLSQNYEPLLTDYALYSLISTTQSVQSLFACKAPEAVLYQQLSPKSDVYCLGIVILEIMTRKFPAQYLNNQKAGTDVVQWVRQAISEGRLWELVDPEIANASKESLDQMEKMLQIGATCTESDHESRIGMREAIRSIEEVQI